MAKHKYYEQDGKKFVTAGPLPFDVTEYDAWTGSGAWEAGVHRAKILGIAFAQSDKGSLQAEVQLENICGPDERNDFVGQVMTDYFTIKSSAGSDKAAAFFKGFLAQVNPDGLKPENLTKGKQPDMSYFVGAIIELSTFAETYKDKTGEEKTRMKVRRGSVKCIEKPVVKGNSKKTEDNVDAFINAAE